MDLQTYLTNAVQGARNQRMANSDQLTLGGLIKRLEPIAKKDYRCHDNSPATVGFDFEFLHPTTFDSWRGSYCELALGFDCSKCSYSRKSEAPIIHDFLKMCEDTVGKTFTGWKGGEFTMYEETPVWVANPGNSGNTAIIEVVDEDYAITLITALREY